MVPFLGIVTYRDVPECRHWIVVDPLVVVGEQMEPVSGLILVVCSMAFAGLKCN